MITCQEKGYLRTMAGLKYKYWPEPESFGDETSHRIGGGSELSTTDAFRLPH